MRKLHKEMTTNLNYLWTDRKNWILSFFMIFLGGLIYIFYRPENILFFKVTDNLGITPFIDNVKSNVTLLQLPSFFVNSLPAGLWTASYLLMMYLSTKFYTRNMRLMLSLPLPISAIVLEFMQLVGWCPGVFDIYDLICYIVPLIIFVKSIK